MIITSYEHVHSFKCPTGKFETFVFNIEPLHGDYLESIRISEIPKDTINWDDSLKNSVSLSSKQIHQGKSHSGSFENDSSLISTDSPRSHTLENFGKENLFLEGFGQRDEKMLMLTLGSSPQQIVLPWTDWNKLSPSDQNPLDNEILLLSKDNEKFSIPVASLWKSRFRLYLRVSELLAKNCKYSLITCVSVAGVDSDSPKGYKMSKMNQFLLNEPFLPGVLLFEEGSPLTFIRFEE